MCSLTCNLHCVKANAFRHNPNCYGFSNCHQTALSSSYLRIITYSHRPTFVTSLPGHGNHPTCFSLFIEPQTKLRHILVAIQVFDQSVQSIYFLAWHEHVSVGESSISRNPITQVTNSQALTTWIKSSTCSKIESVSLRIVMSVNVNLTTQKWGRHWKLLLLLLLFVEE